MQNFPHSILNILRPHDCLKIGAFVKADVNNKVVKVTRLNLKSSQFGSFALYKQKTLNSIYLRLEMPSPNVLDRGRCSGNP